ncbi:macrophage mannose receptor 1-like [Gigantopelta aegis]|uniref:macrophage mannose receptor 1-like n=1 Tax=Gigantopelta aegis TaxID=1735272 RepID=UPI001B88BD9E|nr:macrophage mannose receptor 1-like [Gigantopelta aegis]
MPSTAVILQMRLAVVLCCVFPTYSNIRQFYWIKNSTYDDVTITDKVIYSVNDVRSEMICTIKCADDQVCISFSYNYLDLACHLHSARFTNGASYLPSPGWRHFSSIPGHCPTEDGYVLLLDLNLCFIAKTSYLKWRDARDACIQMGSKLIVLDSADKNAAVSDYINIHEVDYWKTFWIGLTDEATEGEFVWENGNRLDFTAWRYGQPDDGLGGEDFVGLSVDSGVWNDLKSYNTYSYICERTI